MTDQVVNRTAWKRTTNDEGIPCLTVTDWNDHEAIRFSLRYPGIKHYSELDFDNRYTAERTISALTAAFYAGKDQQRRDTRAFLGIKE